MQFNCPIIWMKFTGNVKEAVSADAHTAFASFEAALKITQVVIKVPKLSDNKAKQTLRQVKAQFSKYGKIETINYYSSGADILLLGSNN